MTTPQQTPTVEQISDDLLGLAHEVDVALEATEEAQQLATSAKVDAFVARYQALLEGLSRDERHKAEVRFDRRVIDVRRAAARLARRDPGREVALARDAGFVPFVEQRAPGRSMGLERGAPSATLSVGSDVEAYCGKCKDLREHRIVAMLGAEPKQVVCNSCGSRHNFRTSPARARRTTDGAPSTLTETTGSFRSTASRDADRLREEKARLQQELAAAPEPRPFDRRARYKAGEIISHPDHGRGKVENVLRSSLLVRFVDGLRPVDLA